MKISNIWNEISSMLYWTMLAACTVGPGTVVTCARAGAEYDLSLIWALVFASILAYTLQEGTARLTIISGRSLGQCLRVKYKNTAKIYDTAVVCWLVGISVFFGNTLYECNNWAGGIDAILAIPGTENTATLRISCCVAYAVVVLALLYWDKVDMLGVFLGFMMMGMVCLFFVVVCCMGSDLKQLLWGLVPNIPDKKSDSSAEPADIILSLVGTTSLGFNLFLGGSMAKGKKLETSQRGIAFSTISAMEVSILILIVGAGSYKQPGQHTFSISVLSSLIEKYIGNIGVMVFALGFVAAALSSMLTVPLGAGLTVQSVFSEVDDQELEQEGAKQVGEVKLALINEVELTVKDKNEVEDTEKDEEETGLVQKKEGGEGNEEESSKKTEVEGSAEEGGKERKAGDVEEGRTTKELPRYVYWGIISLMVTIATIVISMNAPRVHVILIAQVFNGCLLPFFAILLLICLNDPQFMSRSPQSVMANCFLFASVTITMFLASNVFLQKILGSLLTGVHMQMGLAAGVSVLGMVGTCFCTSLGPDIVKAYRTARNQN